MKRAVAVSLTVVALGAAVYFGSLHHRATHGSHAGLASTAQACLRNHGWNVVEGAAGHFVAIQGPYKLISNSGETVFRWRPGWTHSELIAKSAQTGFACFRSFSMRGWPL